MCNVLIVERHPLVAEVTRDFIVNRSAGLYGHVASTADIALQMLRDESMAWSRIFLSLDVPGACGSSLAQQIHELGMHARCCIVTGDDRPEFIADARDMGFQGYIPMTASYSDFVRVVNLILDGSRSFPEGISNNTRSRSVRLTRRQEQLLDGVRQGHSSKEIAARYHLSPGTVNNAIYAVMRGLNTTTRSHAVAKAIELGLLRVARNNMNSLGF